MTCLRNADLKRAIRRRPESLSAPGQVSLVAAAAFAGLAALATGATTLPLPASENAEPSSTPVDFAREVLPLFAQHCYHCHGPDEESAGLRFDLRESILPGETGESGAVRPGSPEHSVLFERVVAADPLDRMPLEADPLSERDVDILRRWIEQGAEWPEGARHWAYLPPQRHEPPPVTDEAWPRGEIDRFVLARLETEGLSPSPEADPRTLVRRVHLDLVGLPPEPERVERFLADPAPDAYERLVDELLASPHYGERWALRWLDLARYGDTDGYDFDRVREMWPYRDWVVDSFNRDLPFDRFALEQLAGDLLPEATPEQRLATGFIRNSPVPQYRFDLLVDRVNAVGTVFLGLTMECAQCHNHKFDPVTQREFYELYALFDNDSDEELELASPLTGGIAKALVVTAPDRPRPAKLDVDGSPYQPDEPVYPGLPAAFHERPGEGPATRLDLANWIVDPANPLLARVVANRQWEALFGTALARASEDLGLRTEPPSHPELLDWLAVEFVESGWSLKHLHRILVLSSTYRQDSALTPELLARDPGNRLLARGSRFRVEAELIRDTALAASGLLNPALGGPPVFPPQPRGVSENRFRGAYQWEGSEGPDRYRRGLYTFWKRAALHPGLDLFDAPRRETSCASRQRSITPLQALTTLNGPAFFEAAVHLGLRMAEQGGNDLEAALAHGFLRALGRPPQPDELAELHAFHDEERRRFERDPAAAAALLGPELAAQAGLEGGPEPNEWAALAMAANVLLNLDETITRP